MNGLLRRAADWIVEPLPDEPPLYAVPERQLAAVPQPAHPVVGVVGLARRCGATTIARALGAELGSRGPGAAVVASGARPAVVGLGSSRAAVRLAESLPRLGPPRPTGCLCLAVCDDVERLGAEVRPVAPAVAEVEPGTAALEAAPTLDQTVLVASPETEPALAGAVAETIASVAPPPIVVVNRAPDHGPWLMRADLLVPESRMGARLALAGREPRGWFGKSIQQLADLCAAC